MRTSSCKMCYMTVHRSVDNGNDNICMFLVLDFCYTQHVAAFADTLFVRDINSHRNINHNNRNGYRKTFSDTVIEPSICSCNWILPFILITSPRSSHRIRVTIYSFANMLNANRLFSNSHISIFPNAISSKFASSVNLLHSLRFTNVRQRNQASDKIPFFFHFCETLLFVNSYVHLLNRIMKRFIFILSPHFIQFDTHSPPHSICPSPIQRNEYFIV